MSLTSETLARLKATLDGPPATRTVQVGGGSLWREVDSATAVPSGIIGSTVVGGLLQRLAPAVLVLASGLPTSSQAISWNCFSGTWDQAACWSPTQIPTAADDVYVGASSVDSQSIHLVGTTIRASRNLTVSSVSAGSTHARLFLWDGSLSSNFQTIGDSGRGQFSQSGGNNQTGSLVLGSQATATGGYLLSGGQLDTGTAWVGYFGAGSFVQSGGAHQNNLLLVGQRGQTAGTFYRLEAGSLNVTAEVRVGAVNGAAAFEHSGGSFTVATLGLGAQGFGRYSLSGAGRLTANRVRVGAVAGGEGLAEQTGVGSKATIAELSVGREGQGVYMFGDGGLDTTLVAIEGGQGFIQDFGNHRAGHVEVTAYLATQTGRYDMRGGTLVSNSMNIGSLTRAGEFMQSDGNQLANGDVAVGALGRYVLSNRASLTVTAGAALTSEGKVEILGGYFSGLLISAGELIYGQAGQTAPLFTGRLHNRGSVVLNTDASFGDGLLNESVWPALTGGHTLTVNGQGLQNLGQFELRGGSLQGSGVKQNSGSFSGWGRIEGAGAFTNTGDLLQTGGTLVLANGVANTNQGSWVIEGQRELNLSGAATLLANHGLMRLDGGRITGSGGFVNEVGGVVVGGGTIAARMTNRGTLALAGADRLALTANFLLNSSLIDLRSAGASLSGNAIDNAGLIAGHGRIGNRIDNRADGRIQADGGVLTLSGPVHNAGLIDAAAGGMVLLQGGFERQTGTLMLSGGTIDAGALTLVNEGVIGGHGTLRAGTVANVGQMQFSGGLTQVQAFVDNVDGGRVVVAGGGTATFFRGFESWDGSELRATAGSTAVFFGLLNLHTGSLVSGDGRFDIEGGLVIGDSPGSARVAGSLNFGSASFYDAELGGLLPGTGYDHLAVDGAVRFGGTLKLSFWGGLEAHAGDRFDLFDWGSASGQFAAIDFSAAPLADGLRWDTSALYSSGEIGVSAVPEPGSWALMALGLAALIGRRRAPCLAF